jgi:hypothetical protein
MFLSFKAVWRAAGKLSELIFNWLKSYACLVKLNLSLYGQSWPRMSPTCPEHHLLCLLFKLQIAITARQKDYTYASI